MRKFLTSGAAVLAATTVLSNVARADDCSQGSSEIDGNWYCQAVTTIQYSGLGVAGSYNQITAMDSTSGACSSVAYEYSGSLAPLDEEVSLHFRGPLTLQKLAVYTPSSSTSARKAKARMAKAKAKRDLELHAHGHAHAQGHGHGHAQFHKRNSDREMQEKAEKEKRQLPDVWVTAVIDGATVSWINDWSPDAATATAAAAVAASAADSVATSVLSSAALKAAASTLTTSTTAVAATSTVAQASSVLSSAVYASSSAASDSTTASLASSGSWTRIANYDASSGSASGLVFLNHYGGTGSGIFDYVFGNSLSYSNADGTTGASSSTVLADVTIPSNKEVVVMSDTSCEEEDGCNFYRTGTVAYHGFDGSEKVFMLEFAMPNDDTSGYDMNMPAIWMLNAQIPRTLQYGAADCSCWTTGCGELDLFEVLDSGETRCKSTYHGNNAGGDSDYFVRPENGTIKAVVTMNGETATIKIISSRYDFPSSLSANAVQNLASSSWSDVGGEVSLFDLD